MGMIVDLIIIGIIALSALLAYKKGLISLAIKLFAFIIAIVVTTIIYQPISNLVINTTAIDETIENAILEKANGIMQEEQNDMTGQIIKEAQNNILPETARNLSINIVRAIVMIILIIAIRIGLNFVTALANIIAKLPVIKQINKTGGLIYGLIRGIIIVYAVLLVINFAGEINPKNTIYENVNSSYIGKTMNENNVLQVFFK